MNVLDEFLNYQYNLKLEQNYEFDEDRVLRKLRNQYQYKYHINEVLRRIECREKNKPIIPSNINKGMTRNQIYKLLNYQQKKSIIYIYIYIYCTVNDISYLYIEMSITL